jgi:hypothetical protein
MSFVKFYVDVAYNMVIWDEQQDARSQAWGCLGASKEHIQEDAII